MADSSERIIILSAVVLVIIVLLPNSGLTPTIGTIFDVEIEITTSRDNYTLGESFTATVYLVNSGSKDVWLNPIYELPFRGSSTNDPEPETVVILLDWPHGHMIHVPPKSKFKLIERDFESQYYGDFLITCFGAEKTVLILEPIKVGAIEMWGAEDYLDPELALSHGFKGYVNISYVSEMPPRIIVSPGKVIHYTIRLELIPHVPEFTEAEVLFDPENASEFGVDYVILKNYIRYSPNGTILLSVDEPRNVIMILSVPDGSTGMSVHPRNIIGIGIFSDVPVASTGSVGLNRIPRDDYAWITATIMTVEPSPSLDIVELSSEDKDIPRSLFKAINKALPEAESVQEGEQIRDVPTGERRLAISIAEAESIIHYFGEEKEKDRLYYEYYVSYVDSTFSILIQFHLPDPTS